MRGIRSCFLQSMIHFRKVMLPYLKEKMVNTFFTAFLLSDGMGFILWAIIRIYVILRDQLMKTRFLLLSIKQGDMV